jgi:hypothetical protein
MALTNFMEQSSSWKTLFLVQRSYRCSSVSTVERNTQLHLVQWLRMSWSINQFPIKGKSKLLPVLLTEHHAMKAYWGVEVCSTHSLTSVVYGGEWSASRSGRFTPREISPGLHWIGSWVGPRAGLGAVVKRKIRSLCHPPIHALPLVWETKYQSRVKQHKITVLSS